ncbi:MAG: LPS export ABC transporter periplasmic protein LptC [Cyanobacteria bacterium HKST-UBA04]|nr:LPS export ABC transporter periplasmic protein LptC [Cyanobacteria bacterium HKST-UBA04]MCA9840841.1 LPS export ABC transporter periplasmic protein LptC [Cyanobacteria bacterium HKST-UBA03]
MNPLKHLTTWIKNLNVQQLGFATFLLFLAGFVLASIGYSIIRLNAHPELLEETHTLTDVAEQTSGDLISLTETRNGKPKWIIKVKSIQYNSENTQAAMEMVTGTIYNEEGGVLLNFIAPKGRFYKENSRIELTKTVELQSPSAQITMKAPFMTWSSLKDEIEASGGIVFSKQDFGRTLANKAVFAMDFSAIELYGNVQTWLGNTASAGSQT